MIGKLLCILLLLTHVLNELWIIVEKLVQVGRWIEDACFPSLARGPLLWGCFHQWWKLCYLLPLALVGLDRQKCSCLCDIRLYFDMVFVILLHFPERDHWLSKGLEIESCLLLYDALLDLLVLVVNALELTLARKKVQRHILLRGTESG